MPATNQDPGGCECGCTPTAGTCALILQYVAPFGLTPCPIGADCPLKLVMRDADGGVVYSGDMGFFRSACIKLTDHYIDPADGHDLGAAYIHLEFVPVSPAGYAVTREHLSFTPTCDDTIIENDDGTYHLATGNTPYSCDEAGLHGHWVTGTDRPSYLATLRIYLGVTDVYIDAQRFATACLQEFGVFGCNGLPAAGVTVDVWTDDGKGTHLGTGTTDATGTVLIDLGARTSFYWEATHPRLATGSNTVSITLGDAVGLTLGPAAGFHCFVGCAIPEPATLNITIAGVVHAMTFAGAEGSGSWVYSAGIGANWAIGQDGSCADIQGGADCVGSVSVTSCYPSFACTFNIIATTTPACVAQSYPVTE